jgi:hypothetical protein
MTPEERAKTLLEEFKGSFDSDLLALRIAAHIREAIWEERNGCIEVAAAFSDAQVVHEVQDELVRSGMDPTKVSMAAWVGLMISRRPQP